MSNYVVHSIPGSPYGRTVCATLEEKRLDWRIEPLAAGDQFTPEHLARHPFGKIPVLETSDGTMLYETGPIVRHLDRVHSQPPLTPSAPADQFRVDQVMGAIDSYFFPESSRIIVFERLIGPALLGRTPNEENIAAAMPRSHVIFAAFSALLGNRRWFGADAFSLADIMAASHFELFARVPEWAELVRDRPNLVDWLARAEQRPSMVATSWDALQQRIADEAAAAA